MTKKQKVVTGLIVILLIASIGLTYAWWKMKVHTEKEIILGEMGITATFDEQEVGDEIYEPGLSVDFNGEITNTGDLPAFVKVTNGSTIKFKYLDDQLTITNQLSYIADKENVVELSIRPTSNNYEEHEDVYWYSNKANPQEKFIMLEPGSKVKVTNQAILDGDRMGNKYQGANIKIGGDLIATQVLDGALKYEFGITIDDLDYLSDSRAQNKMQTPSKEADRGIKRLSQLLKRI